MGGRSSNRHQVHVQVLCKDLLNINAGIAKNILEASAEFCPEALAALIVHANKFAHEFNGADIEGINISIIVGPTILSLKDDVRDLGKKVQEAATVVAVTCSSLDDRVSRQRQQSTVR